MKWFNCLLASLLVTFAPYPSASAAEDQPFVASASARAITHVALADLASQRAVDDGAKAFAKKWRDDSTRLRDGLDNSANAAGAEVATALTANRQRMLDDLAALEGPSFDARFAQVAATEIDQLLLSFREASQVGEDARLKSFAEQSLPTLEQNLAAANALQARLGAPID
jgi:putative membrane protein